MHKNTLHSGLLAALLAASLSASPAAASECGLSCCIAAGAEGVGSATGLSVTTQYEWMKMKTIRQGTARVSPQQVIDANLAGKPMMAMYKVPTQMIMQKISANLAWRFDEDDAVVLTVPWIINDMDMMMGMKMMGGIKYSPMRMDTVSGLGDISLLYLRDLWKDADIRTRFRFTLGAGIKAPTGKDDHRSKKGELVHMMMQTGTGSWDGILYAGGTMAFGEHADGGAQWLVLPSATFQFNGRNKLGYKVGDRFDWTLSTRWRATSFFNLKLDLTGSITGHDSTDGTIDPVSGKVAYQNPMSMIDNVNNTGVNSIFGALGFQWVAAPSVILSGEYRLPIRQKANGIQQMTDNWFFLRASFRF
ncbi:MAG: hypothetical protein R8K47_04400 [Mariprofundaceae bacterium]